MQRPLRIGIAGLGTVGTGVLDALKIHEALIAARAGRPIVLAGVCARSRDKRRGDHDLGRIAWHNDPVALARAPDIDLFVELMGGEGDPAKAAVEAALKAGKPVVTANKALIAHHGLGLARLADRAQVPLAFEASVAGAIPIVKTLRESLSGNRIRRVFGILNGTCNFILTKMSAEGAEFADVLREAQRLGYAEADPTFDIGGFDTAHKLAILTSLAFGTEISLESIYIEGIESITRADIINADELGYRIKLLGVAALTEDGVEQRVHPTLVPKGTPIADVEGVDNAVVIKADMSGDLMLEGKGAGSHPTASSVIADICDIARGAKAPAFGVPADALMPCRRAAMRAHEGGYYVSLDLYDRPGEVAAVARVLAGENISIESIVQRGPSLRSLSIGERRKRQTAPFILITHETLESAMRTALEKIENEGHSAGKPRMIRIERL
ncbi:MAG TPA: homoserine dehydrogenase [Aestuariivirgaceae bacterium]|jgi:homoserine dehydrogenase|nr:homoserine dehydrogenase [Aestuariivirgaceae bacterium]